MPDLYSPTTVESVGNGLDRSERQNMTIPERKLPRLRKFDYSSENYYFITICTKDKKCIFGDPKELNEIGKLAEHELQGISEHYDGVRVDKYVIMTNHIHAVIIIGCDGAERSGPFRKTKRSITRSLHC